MSDRKPINKYIPSDFDPSKITKGRKGSHMNAVRMMLPMSVRCKKCGDFTYVGTKFNAKKEVVWDETYLGIKVFRFYMRCRLCSSEFTVKTDPKNQDYIVEHGAERAYEPWRERERQEKLETELQKKKEELDNTAAIQLKSEQTRKQFEDLDQLDYLKRLASKQNRIPADKLRSVIEREPESHTIDSSISSIQCPSEVVISRAGEEIKVGGDLEPKQGFKNEEGSPLQEVRSVSPPYEITSTNTSSLILDHLVESEDETIVEGEQVPQEETSRARLQHSEDVVEMPKKKPSLVCYSDEDE
ncbi:hypothetical protein P9112_009833 [Eukaryota sp. TZLM1-RC]